MARRATDEAANTTEFKDAIERLGLKLCEEAMTRSVRDEFKTYEAIVNLYKAINGSKEL